MSPKTPQQNLKISALRASGTLHLHPEAVVDPAFRDQEFFDPCDAVQVKYEMLRRHRVDEASVAEVARAFGTSRQGFYNARSAFRAQGIAGLIPKRRGPQRAHKCSDEVLDFVEQWRAGDGSEQDLIASLREQFGIRVHPRSIERALVRRKKKRRAK